MRILTEEQLFGAIEGLPFRSERFPEGTVRFELIGSRLSEVTLEGLKLLPFSECYLVGREAMPPLAEAKIDEVSALMLCQSRIVKVHVFEELVGACQDVMRHGRGVDHDLYALDTAARWMLYVSHHDEILLYAKKA